MLLQTQFQGVKAELLLYQVFLINCHLSKYVSFMALSLLFVERGVFLNTKINEREATNDNR